MQYLIAEKAPKLSGVARYSKSKSRPRALPRPPRLTLHSTSRQALHHETLPDEVQDAYGDGRQYRTGHELTPDVQVADYHHRHRLGAQIYHGIIAHSLRILGSNRPSLTPPSPPATLAPGRVHGFTGD